MCENNADESMIDVSVETEYIPTQSQPEHDRFVFAYHITITNNGSVAAKLLSRHWVIIDADEKRQEVNGIGVIGEQPSLASGNSYNYSSGVVLSTPVGTMHGSYQFVDSTGNNFDVPIKPFLLAMPNKVN